MSETCLGAWTHLPDHIKTIIIMPYFRSNVKSFSLYELKEFELSLRITLHHLQRIYESLQDASPHQVRETIQVSRIV